MAQDNTNCLESKSGCSNSRPIVVKKFGGTSVGNVERIKNVARLVDQYLIDNPDHDVVVVVSAMSGETNKLIELAKSCVESPSPRELDVLLAAWGAGERRARVPPPWVRRRAPLLSVVAWRRPSRPPPLRGRPPVAGGRERCGLLHPGRRAPWRRPHPGCPAPLRCGVRL